MTEIKTKHRFTMSTSRNSEFIEGWKTESENQQFVLAQSFAKNSRNLYSQPRTLLKPPNRNISNTWEVLVLTFKPSWNPDNLKSQFNSENYGNTWNSIKFGYTTKYKNAFCARDPDNRSVRLIFNPKKYNKINSENMRNFWYNQQSFYFLEKSACVYV